MLFWPALVMLAGCAYVEAAPPAKPQATSWRQVYGANYNASYARSAAEIWSRFDPEIVDRELGFAQRLGLNSIRVWLDYRTYEDNPALMLSRIEHFLKLCAKHELTVMPVLFDSCGAEAEELKRKGLTEDVHWMRWAPNPGYRYLAPEHWEKLEGYVKAIVGAHLKDPRILAWDVMNEPWWGGKWDDPEQKAVVTRFVRHFCEVVNSMNSQAPTTVGVSLLGWAYVTEDLVGVISFHHYQGDLVPHPQKWKAHLEKANRYAKRTGKPILLTEWGYPLWGAMQRAGRTVISDDEQAKFYQEVLPVVMDSDIGWHVFDLVMGYGPFARVSILQPNGAPRPAATIIEKQLNTERSKDRP